MKGTDEVGFEGCERSSHRIQAITTSPFSVANGPLQPRPAATVDPPASSSRARARTRSERVKRVDWERIDSSRKRVNGREGEEILKF